MATPTPNTDAQSPEAEAPAPGFTAAEWRTLRSLQARYSGSRDLFSQKQLDRLQFIRWLAQDGRLAS
jgi:hypothetical protein